MNCSEPATLISTAPAYSGSGTGSTQGPTGAPGPPTGIGVDWQTPISSSSVNGTVYWESPSSGTVSYYTVNGTNVGTAQEATIQGVPGRSISITIDACNSAGCSSASVSSTAPSYTQAAQVPAAPSAPYIMATGQTWLTIGWNSVSGATDYMVVNGVTGAVVLTSTYGDTLATLDGLACGSPVHYAIRAGNSAGWSAAGPDTEFYTASC